MSDGIRIAARIWLPESAESSPVPALLEYIPYRKRDATRLADEEIHPYLACRGYACVRADIRGSGDSDGLPQDEYVAKEQDDGVEIIAWLARQTWCDGNVGMFGYSWGGYNSLQVAARRPPALKAILTLCSSDDRYVDGDHFTGGCLHECMFLWGSVWTTFGLRPPDPAVVGARWREQWLQRLNDLQFYVEDWLTHQRRDRYWSEGSIADDYRRITCAVYAMGGWVDPAHSAVARLLANLTCPRKGLVGPWGHQYPHQGSPGPAMDWLTESLRWWDYWLKGLDTGIMDEPMYRVWMQETPALRGAHLVPGHWVAEEAWPSREVRPHKYYLAAGRLARQPGERVELVLKPIQTVGITSPRWLPYDNDLHLPADQRIDDVRSLTFDSEILTQDIELLGAPVVTVELAVDRPVAFLIVRLNKVEPDGFSKRISYGVLNLTHRNGHQSPEVMVKGKAYPIRIQLQDCAHALKAGNRLRLAMSTTYWPMIWPSPEPVTLKVWAGESVLELPARVSPLPEQPLKDFGVAFTPKNSGMTVLQAPAPRSEILECDLRDQKLSISGVTDMGVIRLDATGTEMSSSWHDVMQISEGDPESARVEYRFQAALRRGEWDTGAESVLSMSATKHNLVLRCQVKALERGIEIFARDWKQTIPRDHL